MAHSELAYKSMGHLLSAKNEDNPRALREKYLGQLMVVLGIPANRGGHASALMHMLRYVKDRLPSGVSQEMISAIDRYRLGATSLANVVVLLRPYFLGPGSDYIKKQHYLKPYPDELGLRDEI